jgi:Flp pilus assembly protein CpaB
MKARGGRFLLILGAGLAAMAFAVVYLVMSKPSQDVDPSASVPETTITKFVVVAKKDIPPYTTLNESNLGLKEMEESTIPPGAVTDPPSSLYNKVSMVRVDAQKAVLSSQVSSVGFSNALGKGERAYSLPVTARNTFADAITENDRIDILWTTEFKVSVPYRGDDGKIKYEKDIYTSTKTLLQDVKVLRVLSLRPALPTNGSNVDGTTQQTSANNQPQQSLSSLYAEGAPYASVLIIAVNDQAAEVLKYIHDAGGNIDLVLRSSAPARDATGNLMMDASGNEVRGDHDKETTLGVTIDELVNVYGLTPPPSEWLAAPVP